MKIQILSLVAAVGALMLPLQILAQQCDAHYTFDENIQDSGGNGYHGQMIGKDGTKAAPRFVDGKYGQALQLDGTSAMRSFVDLHFDFCPQVTVTAWIQVLGAGAKGSQYIFSTGSGSGPGLRFSGTNLNLSGSANGIIRRNAIRANAGWMFVAGVYDYAEGTYTLYSRNVDRGIDKEMGDGRKEPEEAIWVGAFNDSLSSPAVGLLIDDLHIYGSALGKEEIHKLYIGETEKNLTTANPSSTGQPDGPSFESPIEPQSVPDDLLTNSPTAEGLSSPKIGDNMISNGQSCSDDSQCKPSNGFTGACYSLSGATASCYQRCDEDSDCSSGNQCLSVTLPGGTLDGVCTAD